MGVIALAGLALVFPMFMMMGMLSAGAIGGAISGLMARHAGSNDIEGAEAIAFHAIFVALGMSTFFAILFLTLGGQILTFLGAQEAVLEQALSYSQIFFYWRRAGLAGQYIGQYFARSGRNESHRRLDRCWLAGASGHRHYFHIGRRADAGDGD